MKLSVRPLILKVGGDSSSLWWGDAGYIPERSGSPLQADWPINPTWIFWCVEVRTFLMWGSRANHWTTLTHYDAVFAVFFSEAAHFSFLSKMWRIWRPQRNSNADSLFWNISVRKHLCCLSRTFGTWLFLSWEKFAGAREIMQLALSNATTVRD